MIRSGVRVIRGPDWCHGDQDGGIGCLGTVLEVSRENKTCRVQWDVGTITECKAEGDEGNSDIRIYDNRQAGIKFSSVTCDECSVSGVTGIRWKCVQCHDFDLCNKCYHGDGHDKEHEFVRFTTNHSPCVACPPRKRSKKVKLFGIGPGADVRRYKDDEGKCGKVVEMIDRGTAYEGVASIDWSDKMSEEILAAEGRSDLVMVKPHHLGYAYIDHLPLADLARSVETFINVGDKVQINLNVEVFKSLQKEHGGWNDDMEKILGEVGTVKRTNVERYDNLSVYFEVSGRAWTVLSSACTKISVVEKHDIVRVVNDLNFVKNIQSTGHGGFSGDMKQILGKLGEVFEVDSYGDLQVDFPGIGKYCLSPSVCVKQYNIVLKKAENTDQTESPDESGASSGRSLGEGGASEEQTGMVFDIGIRVVRGQNWSWGEQDGGEGCLGTVTEIGHSNTTGNVPPLCAAVQWDHGYRNTYRVGYENQFDLRIYDTAAVGIKHEPKCTGEGCPEPDIYGFMWQCDNCPDVYLCSNCYHSDKHSIMHAFKRFDYPGHEGQKVPKRQVCARVKLTGMFEGAKVARGPDWRWENQDGGEGLEGEVIAIVNFSLDTDRDGAEVTWDNGHTNVYRLGFKGAVDLKATKSVTMGYYYRDHLPMFKLPEHSKVGPSQKDREGGAAGGTEEEGRIKRDDVVKIGVDIDILQQVQKEANAWSERIVDCIGRNGKVLFVEGQIATVDFDGPKWRLHEMTLIKVNQFKAEEVVRLASNADDVRRLQNGHGPWNDDMKKYLGKKGKVIEVDSDGDVHVTFDTEVLKFNPECLEPATGDVDVDLPSSRSPPSPQSENDRKPTPPVREAWEDDVKGTYKKALERGDASLMEKVLAKYPKVMNDKVEGINNPLLYVCEKKDLGVDIVRVLVRYGAKVNQDSDQGPPLLVAVRNKNLEVTRFLLQNGANKNAANVNGQTAVHIAVQSKDIQMLNLLKDFTCDFNKKDQLGDNPVTDAITIGDEQTMEVVLRHPGIDLQFTNVLGFSPIHTAARKGEKYAVQEILRRHPGELNRQKEDGFTALHHVSCMNHRDIAQLLLQKEDINTELRTREEGQTPLLIACTYASKDVLELLVQSRADVKAVDAHGNNALHLCMKGRPAVMEFSKIQKSDRAEANAEETENRKEILNLLIQHVPVGQKNAEGKLPIEVAENEGIRAHYEKLLKETGQATPTTCEGCEEEEPNYRLFPCEHCVCTDCGGKKCKRCPVERCGKQVSTRERMEE